MIDYVMIHGARPDRDAYVATARGFFPELRLAAPCPVTRGNDPTWGCHLAHRNLWVLAYESNVDVLCVFEDDVRFAEGFSRGDWNAAAAWVGQQPDAILLTGVSFAGGGRGGLQLAAPGIVRVEKFSATQAYIVSRSGLRILLDGESFKRGHVDAQISDNAIRKFVTVPFLTTQWPGYSAVRRADVNDDGKFRQAENLLLRAVQQGSTE
jgi:hypothetical protein